MILILFFQLLWACDCPPVDCNSCQIPLVVGKQQYVCEKTGAILCPNVVCENKDKYFECLAASQRPSFNESEVEDMTSAPSSYVGPKYFGKKLSLEKDEEEDGAHLPTAAVVSEEPKPSWSFKAPKNSRWYWSRKKKRDVASKKKYRLNKKKQHWTLSKGEWLQLYVGAGKVLGVKGLSSASFSIEWREGVYVLGPSRGRLEFHWGSSLQQRHPLYVQLGSWWVKGQNGQLDVSLDKVGWSLNNRTGVLTVKKNTLSSKEHFYPAATKFRLVEDLLIAEKNKASVGRQPANN